MMVVSVKADIADALRLLDGLAKDQVPYATKEAINEAAEEAKKALIAEMPRVFDRPTPYTLNSLFIRYATKQNLSAEVKLKDEAYKGTPATKYLFPEVEGGPRDRKGMEFLLQRTGLLPQGWFVIPTSFAPLDAFGNVPGSMVQKILSQLQASRDYQQNEPAGRRTKYNKSKRAGRYFALSPDARTRGKHVPGIYERLSSGFGGAARPIFIFTAKQPKYRDRYHFYKVGEDAARKAFPGAMIRAIEKAEATAR